MNQKNSFSAGAILLGFWWAAACGSPDIPAGLGGGTGGAPIIIPPAGSSSSSVVASVTTGGFISTGNSYNEPVVVATPPPPAISGGTLLVISQGHKAAVADPDRDQVVIVDIDQLSVLETIPLNRGDEPGRLIEDAAGRVHVALRGSGAVATLDVSLGKEQSRQSVCPYPRGLAYDAKNDVVHVACSGGELITLKSTGGDPIRQLKLDRDLRDIVIDGDLLLVSRFRAAELLVVEPNGSVSARLSPRSPAIIDVSPAVAWRTIPAPGGGALMVFQEEATSEVPNSRGGYGGRCNGVVRSAVSLLRADGSGWTKHNTGAVLPVDVASTNDGSEVSVAAAGAFSNSTTFFSPPIVSVVAPTWDGDTDATGGCPAVGGSTGVTTVTGAGGGTTGTTGSGTGGSSIGGSTGAGGATGDGGTRSPTWPRGQVVAVAYDASGRLLAQTRDPMLIVGDRGVVLPGAVIRDTGHELFHMRTAAELACASCHVEGREDGHVWTFATIGARRTQPINGGILSAMPFHWSGDIKDFDMLMRIIFEEHMSGPMLQEGHVQALANWVNALPAWKPTAPTDPSATDRGRALFNDPAIGCATCHAGEKMTNHAIVNVGTGAPFKVPSLLGLGFRAPYMHNGCAAILDDRFGPCGGGELHGHTSDLTSSQRADLVAYLGTL